MGDNGEGNHKFTDFDCNGDIASHFSHSDDCAKDEDVLEIVTALADFCAKDDTQLSFETGQVLSVLCKTNGNWWWVRKGNTTGYVPTNHITSDPPDVISHPDWQDEEYFESYSTLKLQQEMLSDRARNEAYKTAIDKNRKFIQGKVVLDVGCGTGLLSMMCVKYGGADKVYSIEASNMADRARKLVKLNNLSDQIVVRKGKMEGTMLPEKVDLIISEWMGTLLIFEFMIESVLIARDRWLKDGGRVWPSSARLFLAPTSSSKQQERIGFWESVCGLNYSSIKAAAMSEYFSKPIINDQLNSSELLANPDVMFAIDLSTLTVTELEAMRTEFEFTVNKAGPLHGFGSWFSVGFASLDDSVEENPVLDTGPSSPLTHWKQALFILDEWHRVEPGDVVKGAMAMERSFLWRRHFKVTLSGKILSNSSGTVKRFNKSFGVWR